MRSLRTVVAVLALLLLIAGTAFATRTSLDRHLSPQAASNQPSDSEGEKNDESEAPESEAPESDAPESETPESEAPESEAPDSPHTNADTGDSGTGAQLSDAHAARLVDLLKSAGITASADELKTLAAKYGVGGAVRLEAWADATGKSVTDLGAMFDGGMGWGAIAKQLEQADSSLQLSPGIGWIMGHGHGNGHANANAAKHAQGSAGGSS